MTDIPTHSQFIKHTTSRCTVCNQLTGDATVYSLDGKVYLQRTCSEHGTARFCLSKDGRLYHEAAGPNLGDCCGGKCGTSKPVIQGGAEGTLGANAQGAASPDELSSCVTLIEITQGCNMKCPTCFADALSTASDGHMSYEEFTGKIEAIIAKKGELEILQLSGGEPTVNPDFLRMLEWACAHPKILCVLVNTNGLRASTDHEMISEMARIEDLYDKVHIYLQFDGVQEASQRDLRGGDFRKIRERALDRFRDAKIPVTLAMVVTSQNISYLWDTVVYGLGREEVHGVSFQPEFFSGRSPCSGGAILPDPISAADVITSLCASSRFMTFHDFTPTPCGHPMCQWIGWLGKNDGNILTPSGMGIDLPALQAQIGNRIRYDASDLANCQCDSSELGKLIHEMEGLVQQTKAFRLFIKPFMDARMWDEDRIARCCTHVVRPDGKLDSFCRYYAHGGADGNHAASKPKVNFALV